MISLTLMSSCGAIVKSKANKSITEKNGAIPPEFGKEEATILFITHRRSYNKYLKKNIKKTYKGNFELITADQLDSDSKYSDLTEYRYVFNYDNKTYDYTNSDGEFKTRELKKFYVLDRTSNKKYFGNMTSGFWSKLQNVYLKKLNEKLIGNK